MSKSFASIVALIAAAVSLVYVVWRVWLEPDLAELAVIAGLAIVLWWFLRRGIRAENKPITATSSLKSSVPPPEDVARPERLRLAPEYHCAPLWDDERGSMVDPASLGLSAELQQRIAAWDAIFQATYRQDDPFASGFGDIATEHAWVKQGNAIVEDLGKEWPGQILNRMSGLTRLVIDARHDLGPWDRLPKDRLAWIGEKCGAAEIDAAIVWLDELARERDRLPDWDGDGRDDVARAQEMIRGVLANVPGRYIDVVASGLHSPEWSTRAYVAMALAGHGRTVAVPILRDALAREEDDTARQLIAMTLASAESEGQ